jgi:hypothetical protein
MGIADSKISMLGIVIGVKMMKMTNSKYQNRNIVSSFHILWCILGLTFQ